MGSVFSNKDQVRAMEAQAEAQRREYEARVREQQEHAILEGEDMADQIATVNTGGGDSYSDDPFRRRKRSNNMSINLGIK